MIKIGSFLFLFDVKLIWVIGKLIVIYFNILKVYNNLIIMLYIVRLKFRMGDWFMG